LGEQVPDDIIVSHLKDYRSDVFMTVEGGAKVTIPHIPLT
jgi:hypothetical protein